MVGKIVKGIAGFYYVHVVESGIYECKAKGIFRNRKIKPLVGDNVSIDILNEDEKKGNIIEIFPRTNELIRPAVANVDQALVIFAATSPNPNFNLLDRFLIMMEKQEVPTIICFNKRDLVTEKELNLLKNAYQRCGYQMLFTTALDNREMESVLEILSGKTTVMAGPSGVGKSTLMNALQPMAMMETGDISEKIKRGKHTTRHSEIIHVEGNTYVVDTPGFSSIWIEDFKKDDLKNYFTEFAAYEESCKFKGCAHINEPVCGIKDAVRDGKISEIRYQNYVHMYNELKQIRRF